jgi:hypothetical protein
MVLPALPWDPVGHLRTPFLEWGQGSRTNMKVFVDNRICDICSDYAHKKGVFCNKTQGTITWCECT